MDKRVSVTLDGKAVSEVSEQHLENLIEKIAREKRSLEISRESESLVAESSGKSGFILYWNTGREEKRKSIGLDVFSTEEVQRYFGDFLKGGDSWESEIEWEEDRTGFPWQVVVYFLFLLLVLWSAIKHIFLN